MELAITSANSVSPVRASNLRPFKPGQSGNPSGRPKSLFNRYARKHLLKSVSGDVKQLDCIIDSAIETAIAGGSEGITAAAFLRDSIGEKPSSDIGDLPTTAIQINIDTVGGQVQIKE